MFCRSLFALLYFFFWLLCCLFFFVIRILIAPLISSISLSLIIHVFYQYLLSPKKILERVLMGVICWLKRSHTHTLLFIWYYFDKFLWFNVKRRFEPGQLQTQEYSFKCLTVVQWRVFERDQNINILLCFILFWTWNTQDDGNLGNVSYISHTAIVL